MISGCLSGSVLVSTFLRDSYLGYDYKIGSYFGLDEIIVSYYLG